MRFLDRMDKSLVIMVHLYSSLCHELEQLHHNAVAANVPFKNARGQQGEYESHSSALYNQLTLWSR